jgi:subtilisin family serine protease
VRWAVAAGARVLNLSISGADESRSLRAAIAAALRRGVVVVAAAGNDASTAPAFPAADTGVIGVAATNASDRLYAWSNHGRWVTVAAPGSTEASLRGGASTTFVGTSAAAPAVAGAVGLCLTVAPELSPSRIRMLLVSSADPVRGATFGRLNVGRLLARCASVGQAGTGA